MCPHTCVTNLPKPREHRPDVTPSAVHVGNIVQGARMAWAQGRELSTSEDDADSSKKVSVKFFANFKFWETRETIWASSRQSLSSGFPTRGDNYWSPQLQRLVKKLKFQM